MNYYVQTDPKSNLTEFIIIKEFHKSVIQIQNHQIFCFVFGIWLILIYNEKIHSVNSKRFYEFYL